MARRPGGPQGPLPQSGDASTTTDEIADAAVTTDKLADAAVTLAKLDATGSTDGHVLTVQADGSVGAESATIEKLSVVETKWPGKGRGVYVDKDGDFYVRGINLGIGPNTISTTTHWNTWDWDGWIKPNLDIIKRLGANTVRIQGSWTAYNADPAGYKTKFQQVMNYCRDEMNVKVLYAFLNQQNDALSSANRSAYNAMIVNLVTEYAGAKFLLGWDIGNELNVSGVSDLNTLATNFATDLRAVDATTKITCSAGGIASGLNTAHMTACDSYVDFHDLHIYANPGADSFHHNWLDDARAISTKPLLIGEFGANINASAAAGPHIPEEHQHAHYLKAMRRYATGGDVMGFMMWEARDDNGDSQFGLYDANSNPRQALAEWLRYPETRLDAAADAVLYRTSPIALDNFARANSTTSLGTAPLGGAWTAGLGTWGITSKAGKIQTGDAAGHNVAVVEANTADGVIELEYLKASTYNVGLIYRYASSTSYCLLQAKNGQINLYENNGGTFTNVSGTLFITNYFYGRLRVVLRGNVVFIYLFDRLLGRYASRTFNNTATKHGIYTWTGGTPDGGSTFTKFSVQLPLREY